MRRLANNRIPLTGLGIAGALVLGREARRADWMDLGSASLAGPVGSPVEALRTLSASWTPQTFWNLVWSCLVFGALADMAVQALGWKRVLALLGVGTVAAPLVAIGLEAARGGGGERTATGPVTVEWVLLAALAWSAGPGRVPCFGVALTIPALVLGLAVLETALAMSDVRHGSTDLVRDVGAMWSGAALGAALAAVPVKWRPPPVDAAPVPSPGPVVSADELDRILAKIAASGIKSLDPDERRRLEIASKRLQRSKRV